MSLLDRTQETSAFMSADWVESWLEAFGREREASAVVWETLDDNLPIACALLSRGQYRMGPFQLSTCFLNASGVRGVGCDHNDILSLPEHRERVIADLLALIGGRDTEQLALVGVREKTSRAVESQWRDGYYSGYYSESPYVDLKRVHEAGRGYLALLSANTRAQIRRSQRGFEERHGPALTEIASSPTEARAWFSEMVSLHEASWRARKQRGAFENGPIRKFYVDLIERTARNVDTGRLQVDLLRVRFGTETVAIFFHLLCGGRVHFYQSGLKYQEDNRLRPGLVSHALAVEHYLAQGHDEYDFLGGEAKPVRYKRSLSTDRRSLAWMNFHFPGWRMTLLLRLRRLRQRLGGGDQAPSDPPTKGSITLSHPPTLPALVLGNGVTALGAIRALGRAGIPQYALSDTPSMERTSRWYRPAPESRPGESLREYLERSPLPSAVLIPCSDHAAMAVASLSDELRIRFPSSNPARTLLADLIDKGGLLRLLDRHGVDHPRTSLVDPTTGAGEGGPEAEFFSGAFLKPRDSQRFFARFGVKALLTADSDELKRKLLDLKGHGFGLMIQEYIPGPPSNHFFIDGFIDREGSVRAVFARRRLRMYPPHFGNSSATESVPRGEVAEAEAALLKMLSSNNYRGIFSAEFKRDSDTGRLKLLEINPRVWWYVDFAARCGIDVVCMAYWDALQRPVATASGYQIGRAVVYPYYDFPAGMAMLRSGQLGLFEWFRSVLGAYHPIFSWRDPAPYFVDLSRMARGYIGRRLARIRHRPSA